MSKKNKPLLKLLEEIVFQNDFDQLAQFENPDLWSKILPEEREVLAEVFLLQGIDRLTKGNPEFFRSFNIVNQILPDNIDLLFCQARSLCQAKNIHCLNEAYNVIGKILKIDPTCFRAWLIKGVILSSLGVLSLESQYFTDALNVFDEAETLLTDPSSLDFSDLHWFKGICWYNLGRQSGEAFDIFRAIDSYKKVDANLVDHNGFWNDFANAYIDLAILTNREELLHEAISLCHHATQLDEFYFNGWLNMAVAYQYCFEINGHNDHFQKANECYEKASSIDSENAQLWIKWGTLFLNSCRKWECNDRLKAAIEKLDRAAEIEPNNLIALNRWAEALIWLGSNTENLEFIKDAEKLISYCLTMNPNNPDLWHNYGFCYNELGNYFRDSRYYLQAIDKFQHGLNINPDGQLLWYGMALSHFAISELEEDPSLVEKSICYFSRAFECDEEIFPQLWNDWAIALMKMTELTNDVSYIQEAINKFENGLQINDSSDDAEVDAEWLYHYGCALDFLGDFESNTEHYEKAIAALTKVLQADPTHPYVKFNLGLAYSHLGELTSELECFQKGLDFLQEALSKDGEDGVIWNEIGVILINIGEIIKEPFHPERTQKLFEQAEAKFLKAISLGCLDALYNLACLYSLFGHYNAAMHYIEKAERAGALPSIENLLHDEWLEQLRNTPIFRQFINQLSLKLGLEEQA